MSQVQGNESRDLWGRNGRGSSRSIGPCVNGRLDAGNTSISLQVYKHGDRISNGSAVITEAEEEVQPMIGITSINVPEVNIEGDNETAIQHGNT